MRMRSGVLMAAGWGLWALLGSAAPAGAQVVAGAERRALLDAARGRYYSLTAHGVRSFTCQVHFDFATLGKGLLPAEDVEDRRLLESALFALKVGPGGPSLRYAFPQGSVSRSEETVGAVTLWVSELVQGLFQTWPPWGFAGVVPEDRQVQQVLRDGDGYRVDAKVSGTPVQMRLDRNSLVTEVLSRGGAETEHPQFTQTADGLLYTGAERVDNDPDGRTETRYTIESGMVAGVMLPRAVRLQVGRHVDVRWLMTGCVVERR